MRAKKKIRRSQSPSKVSKFAHRLFNEWQRLELVTEAHSVVIGVSGGADSTALLLALAELRNSGWLGLRLVVAHLDHGLREGSRKDAKWVAQLATKLECEAISGRTNVSRLAQQSGDNIEQAARKARYEFLLRVANRLPSATVLTAHTMDDQAETFLLRLMRGSAAEGLSGIDPVRHIKDNSQVKLVRPLVSWGRRSETEEFCRLRGVQFRSDPMNEDERFARVKVRKNLLPLMKTFNNRIVETLDRTSRLLREDTVVLTAAAADLLAAATRDTAKTRQNPLLLSVKVLAEAPLALRRRALRRWILQARGDLRRIELVHLSAIEKLLHGTKGGRVVELPDGATVLRKGERLELLLKSLEK